jgi:hypothetical protein
MSAVNALADKFRGQFGTELSRVRKLMLGANNERLDFFMDSFYKLSPTHRSGVLAGIGFGVFVIGAMVVWLYFYQVMGLRRDLGEAFEALHELQAARVALDQENKNFDNLVRGIESKTKGLSMKSFFENIGRDQGVTIESPMDQKSPFASDSPFFDAKVQEVRVDMRLTNISIPRLLNFLIEVEKANKYLRVQDLLIRGRFGTKLYFDSQVKIRGYEVSP